MKIFIFGCIRALNYSAIGFGAPNGSSYDLEIIVANNETDARQLLKKKRSFPNPDEVYKTEGPVRPAFGGCYFMKVFEIRELLHLRLMLPVTGEASVGEAPK